MVCSGQVSVMTTAQTDIARFSVAGGLPGGDRASVSDEAGKSGFMSKEEAFMATGPLTRLFFTFALPGICGILFMSLQTLADGLLLGHFAGAASMASINVALPCISFLLAVSLVVGVGAETVVSIGMGQGRRGMANDAFTSASVLGGGLAAAWGLALFVFAPEVAAFAGADNTLAPMCVTYLRTLAPFFPAVSLLFLMDYVLKSLGRPLYAVGVMTGVVALNVVLDVLFIAGLGWGVFGASLATGLSYTAGLLADLVPLCSGRMPLRLCSGRIRTRLMRRVMACGAAEGISELSVGLAIMLFNIILMRYAGAVGIAAFTILNYMQYVAVASFLGTADGIRPVVGYNCGRCRTDRVRGIIGRAFAAVLALGAAFGGGLFFFGEPVLRALFSSDDAVMIAMALEGAKFMAPAIALEGVNILTIGFFTSVGKPRVAGILAFTRSFGLVAAGLLLLPAVFGVTGIWMVPLMAEGLTLLLAVPLLWRGVKGA